MSTVCLHFRDDLEATMDDIRAWNSSIVLAKVDSTAFIDVTEDQALMVWRDRQIVREDLTVFHFQGVEVYTDPTWAEKMRTALLKVSA